MSPVSPPPRPPCASFSPSADEVAGAADVDDIALDELASPALLDAAVHGDLAAGEDRPRLAAGLRDPGQLQELAEEDLSVTDRDRLHRRIVPHAPPVAPHSSGESVTIRTSVIHLPPTLRDRAAERDYRFTRMASALAGLRILVGLIWLYNLSWKLPPDFGKDDAEGLPYYLSLGAEHGLPGFSFFASEVAVPHVGVVGWAIFGAELTAGLLLVLGLQTTFGALLGTVNAITIAALVAPAPGEWRIGYLMLVALNVVPLVAPANLRYSADSALGRV